MNKRQYHQIWYISGKSRKMSTKYGIVTKNYRVRKLKNCAFFKVFQEIGRLTNIGEDVILVNRFNNFVTNETEITSLWDVRGAHGERVWFFDDT